MSTNRYEREAKFLNSLVTARKRRVRLLRQATDEQIKALAEVFINTNELFDSNSKKERLLSKYKKQITTILECKNVDKLRKLFIRYEAILKPLLCVLLSSLIRSAAETVCGAI